MYNKEELEHKHKEARKVMAGRELNEQVVGARERVLQAVIEGAHKACQELNLAPNSAEAKDVVDKQTLGYMMEENNRKFVSENQTNLSAVTEDVKNKIVAQYNRENETGLDFRDDKEEIVRRLKSNVVRLVFTKKGDGSDRVMYATLVPELLGIYNEHGRKYGDQGSFSLAKVDEMNSNIPDFVRVMDLEKEEFRSFKPSTLKDYDNEYNVPSWIESHPDNDAWYNVAKEGEDIRQYVDGNGLFIQADDNRERTARERRYIQEAQDNGVLVDDGTAKALEFISSTMDKKVKGYIYTLTSLEIPEEVQEYINTNQFYRDLSELSVSFQELASEEIEGEYKVTKRPSKLNNSGGSYFIDVGTDKYFLHPYFIINRRTGKVYLDRMGWVEETDASRGLPRAVKRVDRLFGATIENFIEEKELKALPLPQSKRIRKTDRTYDRRLARMQHFAKNPKAVYKPVYDHYDISVKEIPSNASVQIKIKPMNISFEVSPTGIVALDLIENKPVKLVSVKRGTSTLSELRTGLTAYRSKYRGTTYEQRVNTGVAVVEEIFLKNVFNLRRKNLFPEILGD